MTAIWWITLPFAAAISMFFMAPITQVSHTYTSAEKRTNNYFVAQAVSCRPVTAEARVHARANLCGICGAAGFSPRTSAFPCQIQGGSNMTGTDLCVNKPHCAAAVRP